MKEYQVRVYCCNCRGTFVTNVPYGKTVNKEVTCNLCGVSGNCFASDYLGEPREVYGGTNATTE